MSIATEIQRLQQAKTDIKAAIEEKGVEVGNGTLDTYATKISEITGGGGSAEGCVTVTFMNGANVLLTRPVYIGDDCPDPVTQGRIETPTKESTVQYHYTYKGWSEALTNITEDKVIYATFTETVRTYTVTFYDTDGTTVLNTEQVAYGSSSTYVPDARENYLFAGWTPEPTNIMGDLSCIGAWQESYSFADASWDYIAQVSESGRASQAFALGDTKPFKLTTTSGMEFDVEAQIVGFNHDDLADGTGKAGISIIIPTPFYYSLFPDVSIFNNSNYYNYISQISPVLNDTVYGGIPEEIRTHIKTVTKTACNAYSGGWQYGTVNDKVWIPAATEVATKTSNSSHSWANKDGTLYEYFTNEANRKTLYGWGSNGVLEDLATDSSNTCTTRSMAYTGARRRAGIKCYNGTIVQGDSERYKLGFCI